MVKKVTKKVAPEMKKGQTVKFSIRLCNGKTRNCAGTVMKLPPRGARAGSYRVTVVDAKGRSWRPYPN